MERRSRRRLHCTLLVVAWLGAGAAGAAAGAGPRLEGPPAGPAPIARAVRSASPATAVAARAPGVASLAAALVATPLPAGDEQLAAVPPASVVYAGGAGPGAGRHVVLVAGDEEYRSEEALPQLGRILAVHHGFRCTVLFATDPTTGVIDPEARGHIPGLAALDDADLLVLFTRFRRLPDEDMAHLVAYVEAGKPLIGIRTATHAFAYEADSPSPFAHWSWDSEKWPGGFGRQVLGETWVSHHGRHGSESTRGVVPEAMASHPILRGVADVWGPTDVYGIRDLPDDARVLLEGAVLAGMAPDDPPVDGERNAPRMPIAWLRERPREGGGTQRVVAATIGAATDLLSADLRRLLVNAAYWCTGLESAIPERARVDLVGDYEPTPFGFGAFVPGVRPADHAWPAQEPPEGEGKER